MTSSGHHAAEDGSLARSTGGAAARGALLIALALVIGLLLVMFALNDPQTEIVASDTDAAADTADGDDAAAGVEGDADADADAGAGAEGGAAAPAVGEPVEGAEATETIPPITDPEPGADDQPPAPTGQLLPANEVTVLVANGRGTAGVAGGVRDVLVADGYTTEVSNAPATASGVIFYRPGFDANAIAIGQALGAAPDAVLPAPDNIGVSSDAVSDGRLSNANVVVIIGADESVPPA